MLYCRFFTLFACAVALVACTTENPMGQDVPTTDASVVRPDLPNIDIPPVINDPCAQVDAGLSICNGRCVNFQTDRHNCGSCGQECNGFYVCEAGRCVPTCPMGQVQCGGLCVSTQSDTMNCGACGNACPAGKVCRAGQCDIACSANLLLCTTGYDPDPIPDGGLGDGSVDVVIPTDVVLPPIPDGGLRLCADPLNDRRHCGRCNNACGAGETCIGGRCQIFCPPGNLLCNGNCINPMLDSNNCGMCGRICAMGTSCEFGSCQRAVCPMGQSMCNSGCADLQNSPINCGACQRACPAGQACIMGACAARCPAGQTDCMGRCLDLQTDAANCGACGRACAAGQVCNAGVCALQCAMGNVMCGGRCVNTSVDPNNCGACGTMCQVGGFCSGGACMRNCSGGLQMCGATCVDFLSDNNNCGGCGTVCGANTTCVAGTCQRLGAQDGGCTPPSLQCGAVCSNIRFDNQNCGRCGAPCAADRLCFNGACVTACLAGQTRCGAMGTCTDIDRDSQNCGACGNVCGAGLSCAGGMCVADPSFRVTSMNVVAGMCTGAAGVDGQGAGDQRGILAVTAATVLYSGDSSTIWLPNDTLNSVNAVGRIHDAMVSDLRSGVLYFFANMAGTEPTTGMAGNVTQLIEMTDRGVAVVPARAIQLSAPIPMTAGSVGFYSGYGRIIVYTGVVNGWYQVAMPGGVVTQLMGPAPVNPFPCESWAHSGIAEFVGGAQSVVFMSSTAGGIVRQRISTGAVTVVSMTTPGDVCSISISPTRNRWYSQFEATPGYAGGIAGEGITSCPATWDAP